MYLQEPPRGDGASSSVNFLPSRCGPWAAFFSVTVCSCVSNKPQCKGVICQTKFGISDDADVSSESGSVTVLERQSG